MMLSDEPNQLLRWQTPLPQSETSSGRLTAWRDPKIVGAHLMLCQCKRDNNHEYHLGLEFPGLSESIRIKCMKILFVSGSHGMVITTETFQSMFAYWFSTTSFADLNGLSGKPSNLSYISRLLII